MDKSELEKQLRIIKEVVDRCLLSVSPTEEVLGASPSSKRETVPSVEGIDFSMESRAFFKKYAKGMSAPKTFVLMVAYFAQKNKTDTVALGDIQKEWSKMKEIIKPKFATNSAVRARESDWISSPKNSSYSLRPSWKDILKNYDKNS